MVSLNYCILWLVALFLGGKGWRGRKTTRKKSVSFERGKREWKEDGEGKGEGGRRL